MKIFPRGLFVYSLIGWMPAVGAPLEVAPKTLEAAKATPETTPANDEWQAFERAKNAPAQEQKKATEMKPEILKPFYGTGGRNADVTAKVKEHVEIFRRKFAVNPVDLGADPNPFWNKGLHIIYMKDGVRREQRRNENEHILPESFYGPHDAAELRAWLPASRWAGEQGEIQFHADGTFTTPGREGVHRWEAKSAGKIRLVWPDGRALEFAFDYTWSSFSEIENARNVFHVVR